MKYSLLLIVFLLQGCWATLELEEKKTYERKTGTYIVTKCGRPAFINTPKRQTWFRQGNTIILHTDTCHSA